MIVRRVKAIVYEVWFPNDDGELDGLESDYSAVQELVSEWYECRECGKTFRKLNRAKAHRCPSDIPSDISPRTT